MRNVLRIAGKEFADLSGSGLVLVVLIIYVALILKVSYDTYNVVFIQLGATGQRLVNILLDGVWYILTYFGMFVGVVIGFASISSERHRNSLSLLLTKPLYRDSIINGKLLGATCFLACVSGLAIALFTALMLAIFGNSFFTMLPGYLENIPLLLALSLVYVLIFMLLSMLISVLIKDQAYALVLTFLAIFLIKMENTNNVAGDVSMVLTGDTNLGNTLANLSPFTLSEHVSVCLSPPAGMTIDPAVYSLPSAALNIAFYALLLLIANYIVFIRSDVS